MDCLQVPVPKFVYRVYKQPIGPFTPFNPQKVSSDNKKSFVLICNQILEIKNSSYELKTSNPNKIS